MTSKAIAKKLQETEKHYLAGNVVRASRLGQEVIDADPGNADAWHLSGLIHFTAGQPQESETHLRRAIRLDPSAVHFKANLAVVLLNRQQPEEAEKLCREMLRIDSKHTKALASLGTALRQQQRRAESLSVFENAIDVERDAHSLCNLATVLTDLGRLDEAYELLLEARELNPQLPEVHKNLAILLRERGQAEEAQRSLSVVEQQKPDSEYAHLARANLLLEEGHAVESIERYQTAISINPSSPDALYGLGCALLQVGAWEESVEAYRLASVLEPDNARRASGWLYAATLSPVLSYDDVVSLHREWGRQIEARTPVETLHPDLSTDRPLRIGYVSPDLRGHATMRFLYPLLKSQDRSAFQVVMYSETVREDETTDIVRMLGDEWCCTKPLSDDQLAARIKADSIDILIDVAGHTADNRLPVFARKPAPIQVSFLGYPTTTGLSRIDYFLTDAIREPGDIKSHFSEQAVLLPHGACCFQAMHAPDVAPPPHLTNGYITLGSTHRPEKISTASLSAWAQILSELPDARLLIFRDTLKSESLRLRMAHRLQNVGADLSRIDFGWVLPQPHLNVYSRFDILLDVFPWGSGTVAYDAMWMGVPIPTITGDRGGCRATASLMHHCGYPELIAGSITDYVALVKDLASNRNRLKTLRQEIRPAMSNTVCDGGRFTRDVERA